MFKTMFKTHGVTLSLRSILREADLRSGRICAATRQILHGLKAAQDNAGKRS
jgi:hypothetical protein